jgi:flagellar motor switch protein FliN/FliY
MLLDVAVTMTAELGKIKLSIADVLRLGIGSVVQLDRLIGEPVELMVQGKCVARGEVVVVDGRFGVQIKEITDPRKRA